MASVSVISWSIIRPRNIANSRTVKIHLTPSDLNLLYLDYPQRGLLFPKPDPESDFISRLEASLSSALEIYFPLAGRLVKVNNCEDNTASFHIECSKDSPGAKFIHAIADDSVSASDLLQPDGSVPDYLKHFFPTNGVKSVDGVSKPLLALQVTEMKDCIFISFGYNHMVADGASIWSFFSTWSKLCSNPNSDVKPLLLRGWFLDRVAYPIHIPASELETPPLSRDIYSLPTTTQERVFHFTKKNISNLKALACSSSDQKISSLQAVLAHLWRSITRHSGVDQEGESHCRVAADMRQRLSPPLEKSCFGNVVSLGIATATVGELQDHGLSWAALRISNMVRSLNGEDFKTRGENWAKSVKIPKIGSGINNSDSVSVTGSHRFPLYDNDFGWGKPIAARAGPSNNINGKLVVFTGVEEGSIDVHATLWSHLLVKLLADVEFGNYVVAEI